MSQKKKIKLQASQIYRIWNCPGSLYLDMELDREYKFNPWAGKASYGSKLHDVAERSFNMSDGALNTTIKKLLKEEGLKPGIDNFDKGLHTVKFYVDYVRKIEKSRVTVKLEVSEPEQKFRKTVAGVECVAKTDYVIIWMSRTTIHIDVFDLKTGNFNYEESAKDQLFFSVLIIIAKLYKTSEKRTITYTTHIVQPNYWKEDERVVTFSGDGSVRDFMHVFKTQNEMVQKNGKNNFHSGNHCKFCPAILSCPHAQFIGEFVDFFRATYTEEKAEFIAPELLEYMFLNKELFENYLKNVEGVILGLMEKGVTFPNVHTKTTSGRRVWNDEKKVKRKLKHLGEKIYKPRELKTPAQVEKLSGKENISDLVSQPKYKKLVAGQPDNPFKDMEVK